MHFLAPAGALLALLLVGCASGPRGRVMTAVDGREVTAALDEYEQYRDNEGADGRLLARIAALMLEEAALSETDLESRAAFTQLSLAGTAGVDSLERLAAAEHPVTIRARALAILKRRGDGSAVAALRGFLDEEDPEVVGLAVVSLDPEDDLARLLTLLSHPAGDVRGAAVAQFNGGSESVEVRATLVEMARVDPLASVRARAVRALGAFGASAFEPLRERLSDADVSVRLAAVGALVRADRERGYASLGPLLEMAPSRAGIEAARLLSATNASGEDGSGATHARAYLSRALAVGDADARAQAALAVVSFPAGRGFREEVERIAVEEQDRRVKLSLARALLFGDEENSVGQEILRALTEDLDMPGVQAASILAKAGSDEAIQALTSALAADAAPIRRVASRALARDAERPDDARSALRDEDPLVQIHADGGILASLNVS